MCDRARVYATVLYNVIYYIVYYTVLDFEKEQKRYSDNTYKFCVPTKLKTEHKRG